MNRQERYQKYLQLCAELPDGQGTINHEFAKVACGKRANDEDIIKYLEHMHVRLDCGDFRIIMILRMLYLYPDTPLIGEEAKAEIKELLLDFDYWYGENVKFPGKHIIWTENHVMLFMVCEYLATKLYPNEFFRFRGKKGSEISGEIYPKLIDWIDMKLRVGFSEWDSNCYADENMISLLNLYDFSGDSVLKKKSKALIDIITFSFAINSFHGNYCCTHGRSYAHLLMFQNRTSTTLLEKLLWGGSPIEKQEGLLHIGSLALATSSYEPQPLIEKIATDPTLTLEDREQQSFDAEDAHLFGKGYDTYEDMTLFWHNMAYTHVNVVEKMYEMCEKFGIMVNPAVYPEYRYLLKCRKQGVQPEPCRVSTYMSRVNILNFRTPDYFLSCAQDFRKGQLGFQQHIWQATFEDDAVIFTTHPGTLGIGDGRPDFWSGNHFHPRALQYRNTVVCIYNITEKCPLPYSHAYFPRKKFDEVYEVQNWIFARKGDGYAALYSQNGYEWSQDPKWSDQEVICHSKQNIWICQLGSQKENGSFLHFISQILACDLQCEGTKVSFQTPAKDQIQCGWEELFTVNGNEYPIRNYKRFDNSICQSEYLSGTYHITYQGESLDISL
ncbi:MAG: hypothetical protein ACOX6P_09065 [Candidatus Merdivicinus sp.]|jgi:hypothetical protein